MYEYGTESGSEIMALGLCHCIGEQAERTDSFEDGMDSFIECMQCKGRYSTKQFLKVNRYYSHTEPCEPSILVCSGSSTAFLSYLSMRILRDIV